MSLEHSCPHLAGHLSVCRLDRWHAQEILEEPLLLCETILLLPVPVLRCKITTDTQSSCRFSTDPPFSVASSPSKNLHLRRKGTGIFASAQSCAEQKKGRVGSAVACSPTSTLHLLTSDCCSSQVPSLQRWYFGEREGV